MENKNIGLKIMVIILCLLVVGLSGYIVYDKVLSDEKENVQDATSNENSDEQDIYEELDENTKSELKKVFRFVYHYYDTGNTYCGGHTDEYITTSKTPSNGFYASKEFTSYSEMINYLKGYMSEEVVNGKNSIKKEYYTEKDGKLYCEDLGKGGNLYQLENITIKKSKTSTNIVYTTIETELVYEDTMYETYKVTFEKSDNRWIISSYEKQD